MIAKAIAAASRGLPDDVLQRLGGDFGDAVRDAVRELAGLPSDARKLRRAAWAAAARVPTPAGIRGIHKSWLEHVLDDLPARTRIDLADGGRDPVGVWLVRRATAGFPAMAPVGLVREVGDLDAALALSATALAVWLESIGAEQVALLAIVSKTIELVQRRPGPIGDRLRAAVARIWPFFRKDLLGTPLSHVARRCADTPLEDGDVLEGSLLGLIRIGARTIAPHVATRGTAAEQLAHRLPRSLGLVVLAELRAYAATSAAAAPTWRVLSHVSVVPR